MWQNKNNKHSSAFCDPLWNIASLSYPLINYWSVQGSILRVNIITTPFFFLSLNMLSDVASFTFCNLQIFWYLCIKKKITWLKWSEMIELSLQSSVRVQSLFQITPVAAKMMRIRMITTIRPIMIIILMFFHQYFLATRVDVLWNESA